MLYLVTGGAGSIGGSLVHRLLEKDELATIRIFSRNDSTHHEFKTQLPEKYKDRVRTILGDVRDENAVKRAIVNCDCVFHCAALKHVIGSGYNAMEVADVNIKGTQIVLEAAHQEEHCKTIVLLSTDKVVNPTNVMGATKLVAEKIILESTWSNLRRRVIRLGNVWNSRGSVFPTFCKKLLTNETISVTNLQATRFVVTRKEAADLLIYASKITTPEPLLLTKIMPAISVAKIVELAGKKTEKKIKTKLIGLQPGEKLHEEILTDQEMSRIVSVKNNIITVGLDKENSLTEAIVRTSDKAEEVDLEKLLKDGQPKHTT